MVCIMWGGGYPGMLCYYTSETNLTAPPENNWQSVMGCDQSAPTCRLVTNNNQNGDGASTVSAHEQYFRREQQLIQRQSHLGWEFVEPTGWRQRQH